MDAKNPLQKEEQEKEVGIFGKIKNSIYSPDFYKDLLDKKKPAYSWGYFFKFSLIIGIISATIFSIVAIPAINTFVKDFVASAVSKYPSELEVKVQKGIVSTNVQEPYAIAMPKDEKGDSVTSDSFKNFIVIDTKNEFSFSKFKEYDTNVWLLKDSIVYYNNKEVTIKSLSEIGDVTINKNFIQDIVTKISPYLNFVSIFFAVFIFIGMFFAAFFKAVYLIFGALIIWLVLKIKKVEIGYKKSYLIGLHLMTLPTIIFLLPGDNWKFRFSYTIVLAIITWINFSGPQKIKSEQPAVELEEKTREIASQPVVAISENQ
jgi:hypothetical protein